VSALDPAHESVPSAPDRVRRRFRRRSDDTIEPGQEALATLHAELVLLREENARLKAARHQRADLSDVLDRARQLANDQLDRDSDADDAEQLLVDSMVIRESLLEICQEVERSMVAFEARLSALAGSPGGDPAVETGPDDEVSHDRSALG